MIVREGIVCLVDKFVSEMRSDSDTCETVQAKPHSKLNTDSGNMLDLSHYSKQDINTFHRCVTNQRALIICGKCQL